MKVGDFLGGSTTTDIATNTNYDAFIAEASKTHGVEPELIRAVIGGESDFNPNAVSPKKATGLMQLMEGTAKEMGVKDITNPRENIMGGTKYLAQLSKKYGGDIPLTLAAYNAGPGSVDKHGGIPPFPETQKYVPKVLGRYNEYKKSRSTKTNIKVSDFLDSPVEEIPEKNIPAVMPEVPVQSKMSLTEKIGRETENIGQEFKKFGKRAMDAAPTVPVGIAETAAHLGTMAYGVPLSGLGQMIDIATEGKYKIGDKIAETLIYNPQTKGGELVRDILFAPFTASSMVGEKRADTLYDELSKEYGPDDIRTSLYPAIRKSIWDIAGIAITGKLSHRGGKPKTKPHEGPPPELDTLFAKEGPVVKGEELVPSKSIKMPHEVEMKDITQKPKEQPKLPAPPEKEIKELPSGQGFELVGKSKGEGKLIDASKYRRNKTEKAFLDENRKKDAERKPGEQSTTRRYGIAPEEIKEPAATPGTLRGEIVKRGGILSDEFEALFKDRAPTEQRLSRKSGNKMDELETELIEDGFLTPTENLKDVIKDSDRLGMKRLSDEQKVKWEAPGEEPPSLKKTKEKESDTSFEFGENVKKSKPEKPVIKSEPKPVSEVAKTEKVAGTKPDEAVKPEKAIETTTPPKPKGKEAWEMTADEYVESELAKNKYKESYVADEKLLKEFKQTATKKWREELNKRAVDGRISDKALDDFEKTYGNNVLAHEFRGQKEPGTKGWVPKDVREQPIPKQRKRTALEKPIYERTWEEHRAEVTKQQERKLTKTEWKQERKLYDSAVSKHSYETGKLPPSTEKTDVVLEGEGGVVKLRSPKEIAKDINTALGERGSLGDAEWTIEQKKAKVRLRKDIEGIKESARQKGKSVSKYLTDLGYDPKVAAYISQRAGQTKEPPATTPSSTDKIAEKPDKQIKIPILGDVGKGVVDAYKDIKKMGDEYLGPISTRLGNIDPSIKYRLRKFEHNKRQKHIENTERILPMLKKIKSMSSEDRSIFDLARKNGESETIQRVLRKYNIDNEYRETRKVLDELYKEAKSVGFDVGYRKHFHPRIIKDPEGFLNHLQKGDWWDMLDKAIKEKEVELKRYLEVDEKAEVVNSVLRGYGPGHIKLSKPDQFKSRTVIPLTPELNKFYMGADASLVRYIDKVGDSIEARKLFGKGENINDSIGSYVLDLFSKGKLTPKNEIILRDILNARFNERGTRGVVGMYKNLSYIDTMGSPISAITQIGDLAWALYKNGVPKTAGATIRAIAGKSKIKPKDLGIKSIAEEFAEPSKLSKAVGTVFKAVGLEKIDFIGKEALVNSTIKKAQSMAKNPKKIGKLRAELEPIFGKETESLISDLREGRNSDNVKLYAFNVLSDFQPITLTEMPQKYLTGGNGRIFYMLKTFTIKQFDVYRREVFQQIKKPGTRVKGIRNLVRLTACFVAANATADTIKSLVLNRHLDPEDLAVDNILRLFGISKFVTWKAREEGAGSAMVRQIAPPFKFIDAATKDISNIRKGKKLETPSSIPVGGKLYYWWFGKGAEKSERRKKSKSKYRLPGVVAPKIRSIDTKSKPLKLRNAIQLRK